MDLPAAQIEEALALIEAAHHDSSVSVRVGMWRHVHGDTSRRSRLTLDVTVFQPGSNQMCEVASFPDADALLQWAKDGAKIEEVADAHT